MTKLKLSYLRHIRRRQGSLETTIMLRKIEGSKKRERPNMRWIDTIKEAIGTSLQELSRAVEDGTLWAALNHRLPRVRDNST